MKGEKEQARCSRCGQVRPLGALNGYDPFKGDYSHAYCRELAKCDSQEAREFIAWLAEALEA